MRYVSTRGDAPGLDFADAVLSGLARDGGLYVPEAWPTIDPGEFDHLSSLSYSDLAFDIMDRFVGDSIAPAALKRVIENAYGASSKFGHASVTPLRQLDTNDWLLELFHGPTLAFKDVALQFLGGLFELLLAERNTSLTIVGATSGDTGSAAIEACRDRDNIRIVMLHPADRVSDVQRRQMTTVLSDNVYNVAVEGTFDDCQAIVKAMFNDLEFRDRHNLGAVNSINWARVMAQTVYYFYAAFSLGAASGRAVDFSVPTGNFGDVFAGYVAARMGLPVGRLIVATNINDILFRALSGGEYSRHGVRPTISPAMDIQVSSNFERLLFDLYDRDGKELAGLMDAFSKTGEFVLGEPQLKEAAKTFVARRVDEQATLSGIRNTFESAGILIDPHTAIGIEARSAGRLAEGVPLVTLATAHPAKFPEPVQKATGQWPELPSQLADLFEREERYQTLPNDAEAIKEFVRSRN